MRRLAPALAVTLTLVACRHAAPPAPAPAPAPAGPNPRILLDRARALRAEGDLAGARQRLETALASGGSDEVRLELADLILADGREVHRAGALLAEVRKADGRRLALLLGQFAEASGDDAGAAEAYGLALEQGPDPDVRLRRALALERLGRVGEAVQELALAQRERPEDPVIRARLAEGYEAAGRLDDAEAELLAAARATPARPAGWDRLAAFYDRTGRAEQARAARAKARELAGGGRERPLRPLPPSRR